MFVFGWNSCYLRDGAELLKLSITWIIDCVCVEKNPTVQKLFKFRTFDSENKVPNEIKHARAKLLYKKK